VKEKAINKLRNDILGVCKYCKKYLFMRKSKEKHQCISHKSSIYTVEKCSKTHRIRKQILKIEAEA
jgi:hypothetical protein